MGVGRARERKNPAGLNGTPCAALSGIHVRQAFLPAPDSLSFAAYTKYKTFRYKNHAEALGPKRNFDADALCALRRCGEILHTHVTALKQRDK
jgi:hypothetical protein